MVERLHPRLVLLIDSVDLGLPGGSCQLLHPSEIADGDLSTHRLSLTMLIAELERRTGTRIRILAIQPLRITLGEGLSPVVRETIDGLMREFLSSAKAEPAGE